MIEVIRSIDVDASPAEVWAVLADFGGISGWADNVDHSCLMSDQREGAGTVRRIQSGRTALVERVTVWDPPSTLAYAFEGLPPVVRAATNTWHVYPVETGARVSLTSRVDAGPRPPQQLVARAVGRRLAQASDQMLAGLNVRSLLDRRDPERTGAPS